MLGIQYISLGVSVIILIIELAIFLYRRRLNQDARVNIVVSIAAIVLVIFLITISF